MILFAFTVGMITVDDFIVALAKVCPERIVLNVRDNQILTIPIRCAPGDFIYAPHRNGFAVPVRIHIIDLFPQGTDRHKPFCRHGDGRYPDSIPSPDGAIPVCIVLTVLVPFVEFGIDEETLRANVCHHWCITVKALVCTETLPCKS